jgi:hypothetical protein
VATVAYAWKSSVSLGARCAESLAAKNIESSVPEGARIGDRAVGKETALVSPGYLATVIRVSAVNVEVRLMARTVLQGSADTSAWTSKCTATLRISSSSRCSPERFSLSAMAHCSEAATRQQHQDSAKPCPRGRRRRLKSHW